MHICDVCGNTVAHIGFEQVCKPCLVWLKTKGRQQAQVVEKDVEDKDVEDKDNQEYMLAYFAITLEQFEAVSHDNLADIVDSEFASWYKSDAKRVLWHEYRANAFTKKGALKKVAEKKIKKLVDNFVEAEPQPKPEHIKRSAGKQKALDNAAEARSTAKLFGAKALTGSAKQKSWGEALRKAFIESIKNDEVLNAVLNNRDAQKAKFWIEIRELDYSEIEILLLGYDSYENSVRKSEAISRVKNIIEKQGRDSFYAQAKIRELKEVYGVSL